MEEVEAKSNPVALSEATLQEYIGRYGRGVEATLAD
jgi:hypothetical protein